MAGIAKIFVGGISAIGGYLAVSLWGPFSGGFDYAAATVEERQKFLETKAKNFSRGYNLTAGGSSEITNVYVDAESDLVSISVQLKGEDLRYIAADQLEGFRKTILKAACTLTDKQLLNETGFVQRIRFFRPGGGNLMTVEINGENCASSRA
jgi:hypothetical protein